VANSTRSAATINTNIVLGTLFFKLGQRFDPYSVDRVDLVDSQTNLVIESIPAVDIRRISVGYYEITTSSIWNTHPQTVLDTWYFTPENPGPQNSAAETVVIRIGSPTNAVTVDDLRNKFLKGMDLTDTSGEDIDDTTLEKFIAVAVKTVERELHIDINPRVVICTPAAGEVFDVEEPNYDYELNDYWKWGFMKLYRMPVQKVDKMELIYPTGQKIMDIPTPWIKLRKDHGQINLVPTAGTLSQVMLGTGYYLPMLSAGILGDLPSMFRIHYTTGFKMIPDDIWDAIGKVAAIEILIILDANAQGLSSSSISADGLNISYSRTNSPSQILYQARIDMYGKQLEEFYQDAYRYYHGANLTVA